MGQNISLTRAFQFSISLCVLCKFSLEEKGWILKYVDISGATDGVPPNNHFYSFILSSRLVLQMAL